MREAFQRVSPDLLGREVEISEPMLLAGGASKEAWAVDADGERLLVRRAAVGVIHRHTLSLADEFAVIEAAHEAGVRVPRPYGYVADLAGREAFVMERLEGETIGRRIVRRPELAAAREALPLQMAEELAKIHAIPPERVPFLARVALRADRGRAGRGRRAAPGDRARTLVAARAPPARAPAGARPRRLPDRQHDGRRAGPRRRPRLGVRPHRRPGARPRVRARARLALRRRRQAPRRNRRGRSRTSSATTS